MRKSFNDTREKNKHSRSVMKKILEQENEVIVNTEAEVEVEVEADTNYIIKQQWNAISATSLDTINLSVQIVIKKQTMLNKKKMSCC